MCMESKIFKIVDRHRRKDTALHLGLSVLVVEAWMYIVCNLARFWKQPEINQGIVFHAPTILVSVDS